MLAEGADKVLRQGVALVNIAANLADKAFLALGLGLRLYIFLIIGVGDSLGVGNYARLGYAANKHSVGVKVYVLLDLKGHKGIDVTL